MRPRPVFSMLAWMLVLGVAAAGALAARPVAKGRFKGTLSTPAVNGFKAKVAFHINKGRSAMTGFSFETLGCEGAGGFQPGKDPYAKVKVAKIVVSPTGSFKTPSITKKPDPVSRKVKGSVMTLKVKGSFPTARKAKGSVTFSESFPNAAEPGGAQKCHVTIQFTAAA